MENISIKQGETIDDLELDGLCIIQKESGFKFGVDAVLLADFAKQTHSKRTLDLCTGTGIIPILLSAKTKTPTICALEIQEEIADMAQRSVKKNNLQSRVKIECGDLKDATNIYGRSTFDKITCNPPYMKNSAALQNERDTLSISRHEICCTLEDVIKESASLLISKGRLYMVHRPQRLTDIISLMRKHKIEPKKLRFVAPKMGKEPNLLLVEGILDGGAEMRIMPTLYVYNPDGTYTDEINTIYGRN